MWAARLATTAFLTGEGLAGVIMYWPVAVLLGVAAAALVAMAYPVSLLLAESAGSYLYLAGYFALSIGDIALLVVVIGMALRRRAEARRIEQRLRSRLDLERPGVAP